MIEVLIERMIAEGKITQEQLDAMVAEAKAMIPEPPPITEELEGLRKRQQATESALMGIMMRLL